MKKLVASYGNALTNYVIGVVLMVIFSTIFTNFGTVNHISVLLSDLAILGFLALGQTFPVLTGGIDMSIPYTLCSVAVAINYCMNNYGFGLPAALLVGFLLAVAVGALNGFGVAYMRIHPMIMTYGMNSILMGLLLTWTGGTAGGNTAQTLQTFSKTKIGFIPVVTLLFVLGLVALMFLLKRTSYGKHLYAVGNSRKAAFFSGIRVRRTIMITYIISSVCVAVGGVIMSGRVGLTYLGMGDSYMFITLAVVAIGGISMNGGSGNVVGASSGAVIIIILLSVLLVINVSAGMQQLLYGVVLLFAIILESNKHRLKRHKKKE